MNRSDDHDDRPTLPSDPLHNPEGFAGRHLFRLILIVAAFVAAIVASGYIDFGGC